MSQHTLKITVKESDKTIGITLEGRVAGPWVAELSRVWVETAPHLESRQLILDIRNVTYADAAGLEALRGICAQTRPLVAAGTPWTEYLAGEIKEKESDGVDEEVAHG
jgi:anti-anti-sigma regulatory factor